MLNVGVIGASGYTGLELVKILTRHPQVRLRFATSRTHAGKSLAELYPGAPKIPLEDSQDADFELVDLIFLCLPHAASAPPAAHALESGIRIVDLSADFRLSDADAYASAYGEAHQAPDWLARFVYGLPELNREALRGAQYASGVGCNATATNLALWAVVQGGLLDMNQPLLADIKVGSSEAGNAPSESSHHPVRSGVVRPFSLTGHRHEAEVRQIFARYGAIDVRMVVTSVEMVRGAAAAVHVTLPTGLAEKDIWRCYRAAWNDEPFVRIVHERAGISRHPEPRLLAGTNYADVGWAYDPDTGRTVLLSAIDNLGKGAAGSAVQCMNLMCGFDETTALMFGGIYP